MVILAMEAQTSVKFGFDMVRSRKPSREGVSSFLESLRSISFQVVEADHPEGGNSNGEIFHNRGR